MVYCKTFNESLLLLVQLAKFQLVFCRKWSTSCLWVQYIQSDVFFVHNWLFCETVCQGWSTTPADHILLWNKKCPFPGTWSIFNFKYPSQVLFFSFLWKRWILWIDKIFPIMFDFREHTCRVLSSDFQHYTL